MEKKQKNKSQKKSNSVTVAKGVTVKRGVEAKARKSPGSSNAGKYKKVAPKKFAGGAGGASKFSFPIDTVARARNALARAHFAPDPEGIKAKVYAMYPQLKKVVVKKNSHSNKKED